MPAFTPNRNLYLPGGGSLSIGGADEVADIDKINQNFQELDTWSGEVDTKIGELDQNAYFVGTDAERLGLLPPKLRDGIRFKCTDTLVEWDRYKGSWRKLSGSASIPSAAWSFTSGSLAGRTATFTIPYAVDAKESVMISQGSGGTGFSFSAMTAVGRNETNTVVSVRLMQIGSLTTQSFVIYWQIISIG